MFSKKSNRTASVNMDQDNQSLEGSEYIENINSSDNDHVFDQPVYVNQVIKPVIPRYDNIKNMFNKIIEFCAKAVTSFKNKTDHFFLKGKFNFLDLDKNSKSGAGDYQELDKYYNNQKEESTNQTVVTPNTLSEQNSLMVNSKAVLSYTTNQFLTINKVTLVKNLILIILLFGFVFTTFLVIFKPIRPTEALKIVKDDLVDLKEGFSKEDIFFKAKKPIAIDLDGKYYFSSKTPNNDNQYEVQLPKKEGTFTFMIYSYEDSLFEKKISQKPIVIKKTFDYTPPTVLKTDIKDKYSELISQIVFETDDSSPNIFVKLGEVETQLYDPIKNFVDNKCKQERKDQGVFKFSCPIEFNNEEIKVLSVYMVDRVGNRVEVVQDKPVAYIEPLKIDCGNIPTVVLSGSYELKCKSNRDTSYSINNSAMQNIQKGGDNKIFLDLSGSKPEEKEYRFDLVFKDPNGEDQKQQYTIFKDNLAPTIKMIPQVIGAGASLIIQNELMEVSEDSSLTYSLLETTQSTGGWYYKYPSGGSFNISKGNGAKITHTAADFPLCNKTVGPEVCPSSYVNNKPGILTYFITAKDKNGNISNYTCNFNTSSKEALCNKN
jgi:hypothetical protein